MFYFKINPGLKKLIEQNSFPLGCKYYCSTQIIALDEIELLHKELIKNKKITEEEFKEMIKNSEKVYFNSTHVCQAPKDGEAESASSCDEAELLKDKIHKKRESPFVDWDKIDQEYELSQKQKGEEQKMTMDKSELTKIRSESSLSFAMSMIGSFFLLVLGAYYLGKHFLQMNDSATYKLVLVVTIVVVLSETVLLMIKLNKQTQGKLSTKEIREKSFAYKFNKNYREKFKDYKLDRTKIHQKTD